MNFDLLHPGLDFVSPCKPEGGPYRAKIEKALASLPEGLSGAAFAAQYVRVSYAMGAPLYAAEIARRTGWDAGRVRQFVCQTLDEVAPKRKTGNRWDTLER